MLGITGSVLVFLLSIPSFTAITSLPKLKTKSDIYQDKDGVSTREAVAQYSARIPKILIASFAVAGFGFSIALAVNAVLHADKSIGNWLNLAQWVSSCVGSSSEAC
jgi:hypothetical protein